MIELKPVGTRSWLDDRGCHALSAKLANRLWERCRGHRGLFVTLTYRRDDYENAQDLYHAASDEQHVPLFLRKVARYLDRSLKGKWFCKLEFQRGGWVHWHLLILDVGRIPHDELARMWGYGHVWVRRLNHRNVKYCTKYTVKSGGVPLWLYGQRPRAIKIIRVSPGFWGEQRAGGLERTKPPDEEDPYDIYGPGPSPVLPIYEPIGDAIERNRDRIVARDDSGHYRHLHADLGSLLVELLELGCGVVEVHQGWLHIDGTLDDLERAACRERARRVAAGRPGSRLHLSRRGNPDASMPWWVDEWHRQEATDMECAG